MHHLFGHEGLICLDADDRRLKRLFKPVLEDELLRMSSGALVDKTTLELREMGYSLPVNSREINLFYMTDDLRARIVKEEANLYRVLDTDLTFSKEEILEELEQFPERFSPNVVLRPLYEEFILPNLAYIGGPSEVPYWLQLKSVFDYHSTVFPALIPRKFGLYIPIPFQKKLSKLGLQAQDLFQDPIALKKEIVKRFSTVSLSLEEEKKSYQQLFAAIIERTQVIDPSLCPTVSAEAKRLFDSLQHLESKLLKAEEKKHQVVLDQLSSVIQLSFPQGTAQERKTNFQDFYLTNRKFIEELLTAFKALEFNYEILLEDNEYNERRLSEILSKEASGA
jgi:bacillithiol biosynthesis cysteine-adding enzyme BshC